MASKYNISDELLAAYLEGNTNAVETQEVLNAIRENPELRDILDVAIHLEEETIYNVLPMKKLAADSGNNICDILCEAAILHKRGISFEERELLSISQKNHWLKPEGTPLHCMGQLLAHYGLMVTRRYDATVDDIQKTLALDNDVIVVVDKEKLYRTEDEDDAPNHAIVVRGVNNEIITLFDPSKQESEISVPSSVFLNAWKESDNYMICVLQSIEDYNPQPINLEDMNLTDDLEELREAIAENAHDVWAKARIKEGWSYGEKRDDVNKKHPDLIPYSALPDNEKDYDRRMALDTIRLVKKLGFDIVKK